MFAADLHLSYWIIHVSNPRNICSHVWTGEQLIKWHNTLFVASRLSYVMRTPRSGDPIGKHIHPLECLISAAHTSTSAICTSISLPHHVNVYSLQNAYKAHIGPPNRRLWIAEQPANNQLWLHRSHAHACIVPMFSLYTYV